MTRARTWFGRRRGAYAAALGALAALGACGTLDACPVCFGDPDSPQVRGAGMAVLFLLAVTACVLGSFASFFIVFVRRVRAAGDPTAAPRGPLER